LNHLMRADFRYLRHLSPILLLCGGCEQPAPPSTGTTADSAWSPQQEVIYQLQEVIKYEDAEEQVRQAHLQRLSLPVAPPPES